MNEDLKSRLNHNPTVEEEAFFHLLVYRMFKACTDKLPGYTLDLHRYEIDDDADDTGYVYEDDDSYCIVLDSRLDFGTLCDYLVHEIAHIDCWERTTENDGTDEGDHCDIWGASYAKMYRIYITTYNEYWETNET
jgi:hypothetical protein